MATTMVPWTVATNDIAFNAPWCLAHDPTTFVANGTASHCCQTKTSLNRNAIERQNTSATPASASLPSCTIGFKSSPVPPDHIKPYWMGNLFIFCGPTFAKSTNAALKNENESFQTTESCLWVSVTTYKSIIILFMCFVFMMGYRLKPKGIDSDTLMCFRTKPDSVCSVSKRHHSVCSKTVIASEGLR